MEELIKQAEQGDAEAQCLLALTYHNGDGLEKSPEKAFRWWMKAAKQEYAYAMPYLIYCYEQGYGTKINKKKAFIYCKKAAEYGIVDTQFYLGQLYYHGLGTKINKKEAFKWINAAAKGHYTEAFGRVGYCYENGIGTRKNIKKALGWYAKAAEHGDVDVQTHLAQTYYDCFVIEETEANIDKIFKWAKMGAKLGNINAQFKLGTIYYEGKVVEQDYQLAMYWLKKAYEEGKVEAFEYIKEICVANRETTESIDENMHSKLIAKMRDLKIYFKKTGNHEKEKLASNLEYELTNGTDLNPWITFAKEWVNLFENKKHKQ